MARSLTRGSDRESAAGESRRASRSSTRTGSARPGSEQPKEAAVVKILWKQEVSGIETRYKCELADGKKQMIEEDDLKEDYPELLERFLEGEDDSDDDELVVTQLRPTSRPTRASASATLDKAKAPTTFYGNRSKPATRSNPAPPPPPRPTRTGKQTRTIVLDDNSDAATDNGSDQDQMDIDDDDHGDSRSAHSSSVQTQKTTTEDDQSDADPAQPVRKLRGAARRSATLRKRPASDDSAAFKSASSSPPAKRRSGRNSQAAEAFTIESGSEDESESQLEIDEPTPPRRAPGRPRKSRAPSSGDDIDFLGTTARRSGRSQGKAAGNAKGKGKGRARNDDSSGDESAGEGEEEEEESEEDEEDSDELEVEWAGQIRPQHLHTTYCIRCSRLPTSVVLKRFEAAKSRAKGKGRRNRDSFKKDTDDEREDLEALGAWYKCGTCYEANHFGCLHEDIKKQLREQLKAEYDLAHPLPLDGDGNPIPRSQFVPHPRTKLELDVDAEYTIDQCPACVKPNARRCFGCGVVGRKTEVDADGDVEVIGEGEEGSGGVEPGLMFRCRTCRRAIHYECCAPNTDDESVEERAESYIKEGQCHDCWRWQTPLEAILAWAPDEHLDKTSSTSQDGLGESAVDGDGKRFPLPSAKHPTAPVDYLVKWKDMSFRRCDWVPHAFLAAKYPAKLVNFLAHGPRINLDPPPEGNELEDDEVPAETDDGLPVNPRALTGDPPRPDPEAESRIPKAWKTVDRVLDVGFRTKKAGEPKFYLEIPRRILDADPSETIGEVEQIDVKWGDLPYGQWTREAPPAEGEEGYDSFVRAYEKWITANQEEMRVPHLSRKQMEHLDQPRGVRLFEDRLALREQPDFISGGKLMDFQLEGVNRMLHSWWVKKGMILADEMGLGKTVQVISFLGTLERKQGARPFLVAVPNSTIPNWVREFEKWAPSIRVVSYSGGKDDRKVIEEKEMFTRKGELKTHVVVATYEALEKNAAVFRKVARWDTLVVDEGQRLKGGKSGLLFKALATLNIGHRVILSGTPIQNNVLELFNLLHFLNPEEVPDPEQLAIENEVLDADKVENIRGMLQPRMLRRTKELVLDLPQLVEIVIPCTVTTLQREMYQSILKREVESIESLAASSAGVRGEKAVTKKGRANLINILMELRKCLGHPYLNHPEMYPVGLPEDEAHRHLTEASTKLVLLEMLLPKLQARGHRVLLFSQFKLTLNLIEDFLNGMGIKYLRLDGSTSTLDRQRGIDAYNAPDSEYLVYLLSTRAGGVGINLTSADTVIIYDQDFNPQQDIQAIARAHRIGQKKPVRVFKLMVKGTCEEKILQACNKKLGLDHLIIKRMDEKDPTEDVESILQYGAKAIFDDEEAAKQAIKYSEKDIDDLIDRSSKPVDKSTTESAGATFAQAQIWRREEGALAEVGVDDLAKDDDGNQHDFWAKILTEKKEQDEQARLERLNNVGRGKRQRNQLVDYTEQGKKRKTPMPESDGLAPIDDSGDEFAPEPLELSGDESGQEVDPAAVAEELAGEQKKKAKPKAPKLARGADDASVATAKAKLDPQTERQLAAKRIGAIESLIGPAQLLQLGELERGLNAVKVSSREAQLAFLKKAVEFIQHELAQCEVVDDPPANAHQPAASVNDQAHLVQAQTARVNGSSASASHPAPTASPAAPAPVPRPAASSAPATFAIPSLIPSQSPAATAAHANGHVPSAQASAAAHASGPSAPALVNGSAAGPAAGPVSPVAARSAASSPVEPRVAEGKAAGALVSPALEMRASLGTAGKAVASGTPGKAAGSPKSPAMGSAAKPKGTPSQVVRDGKSVEVLTLDDSDTE